MPRILSTEITQLKKVLALEDTVLFIGSGISMWSGLPSWLGLISELSSFLESRGLSAELVKREVARNDLIMAASFGFEALSKSDQGDFIRRACRLGIALPHEIHKKIVTLGPRCFVTTNYDPLIEESLKRWQGERFYRTITNRHVTETADIIQARALDFVFKPHGDAGDIDSVILTREQYRQLLGERGRVIEALKVLMSSRPVIFLGFSLRDPDFVYVKDILANTYQGGVREHYAILADVFPEEIPYWRKNHGIHLISYSTADNGKDHSALLKVLDELQNKPAQHIRKVRVKPGANKSKFRPTEILLLARYANHLLPSPKVEFELPLHVRLNRNPRNTDLSLFQFDGSAINQFLDNGPRRALIIGLPGSGKSYAFRCGAARLAQNLHDECLREKFSQRDVTVPFYLDLKLYAGNLYGMMENLLPPGLSVEDLVGRINIKIFIDSINEMPHQYLESGEFGKDLSAFLVRLSGAVVVLGSRTVEGLDKIDLGLFYLDEIEFEYVANEINAQGRKVEGRFQREVLGLLQKPLIFQWLKAGIIDLQNEAHPREVYRSFFEHLSEECSLKYGVDLDLQEILAPIGYEAMDSGSEIVSLTRVQGRIESIIPREASVDSGQFVNWLISKKLLLPQSESRLSFFHQSVTEYLAAYELARLYRGDGEILRQKLGFTRWDQPLFLTLCFLDQVGRKKFIAEVMGADMELAVRASKYLEGALRESVVEEILKSLVASRSTVGHDRIDWVIEEHLVVSAVHAPYLWKLTDIGGTLGGVAAQLLAEELGPEVKKVLFEKMLLKTDDFNFGSHVGEALRRFVGPGDALEVANRIENLLPDATASREYHGLCVGVSNMLADCGVAEVCAAFGPPKKDGIKMRILCDLLREHENDEAVQAMASLVLADVLPAIFSLHLMIAYPDKDHPIGPHNITKPLIEKIMARVGKEAGSRWAAEALRTAVTLRPDLANTVKREMRKSSGVRRASLAVCVREYREAWDELTKLQHMGPAELAEQPLNLIEAMSELDWVGHEELLISLLKIKNQKLAQPLLESLYGNAMEERGALKVDIGPIHWWIDWAEELSAEADPPWVVDRLFHLFSWALPDKTKNSFLDEFNSKSCKHRHVLSKFFLPKVARISTNDFSEDAISFLLSDLAKRDKVDDWGDDLLAVTATEQFVSNRLMPLLPAATGPFRASLLAVLKKVGARHGRRYIK